MSSCLCCHIGSEGLLYGAECDLLVSVAGCHIVSSCLCCHIGSEGLLYDAECDLLVSVAGCHM